MWFSLDRPDRPQRRRRPSHATVVAYLALIVAVVGSTGAAVAAGLIHTRNIANGAVTAPKIRNGAVTHPKIRNNAVGTVKIRNDAVSRPKIRNNAINGAKVANNSLGGNQINESTLNVTRIAHRITGGEFRIPPRRTVAYRLTPTRYRQPANTADTYLGEMRVRFPAGCTLADGRREAGFALAIDHRRIGWAFANDFHTGQFTGDFPIEVVPGHVTSAVRERHVSASVDAICGPGTAAADYPRLLSVHLVVARFR
ncbi:MAG: hypothetical protein J2P57_09305 [Acidimicrobiaceae bacterium]|nr:hypothetical protein [Acidimicrobiaceae bacterium]